MNVFMITAAFLSFGMYYAVALDENKYIRKHLFVSVMFLVAVYTFVDYSVNMVFESFVFYMVVFLLLLFSVFFGYISSNHSQDILADQVTFWDASPENIKNKFSSLLIHKKGIDTNETEEDWTEFREMKIPHFYIENSEGKQFHSSYKLGLINAIETSTLLTKIDSLQYFDNKNTHILHKIIFQKLSNLNISRHININLKYLLFGNNFYLEYFLIDFWERVVIYEALGTGTLEYYCRSEKDNELIGALDNALKSSVQKRGSFLWAKYILHKNRISNAN